MDQKDHLTAVRAVARLAGVHLIILGEGPLRAALENEAERLGVGDRVVLGGFRRDVPAVMAAADVIALPSRWEGFSLAALEALAVGTPLVATSITGLGWLSNGVDAVLVPPGSVEELSDALQSVLEDPVGAARLSEAGRQTAARFSLPRMAEAYSSVYRDLLERS